MNETSEPNQDNNTNSEQPAPVVEGRVSVEPVNELQPATVPVKEARPGAMPLGAPVEVPLIKYFGLTIAQIRGLLMKGLLGCLIAAAAVAVIAILLGGMGDIAGRAVGTLFVAMLHIGILFILFPADHSSVSPRKSVNMLINSLLVIVVCSFFTAVAHIWALIDWSVAWKLYSTYIVVFISLCHAKALMDLKENDLTVRSLVASNDTIITVVAALVIVRIFMPEVDVFMNGFYGRLLGALAVVDVTLSIVAVVRHRMYLQLHPELLEKHGDAAAKISAGRIALILVGVFAAILVIFSLVRAGWQ